MKKLLMTLVAIFAIGTVFAESIFTKNHYYNNKFSRMTYTTQERVYDLKDDDVDEVCDLMSFLEYFYEEDYDEDYDDFEEWFFSEYYYYTVIEVGYSKDTGHMNCFSYAFVFKTKDAYKAFRKVLERVPVAPYLETGLYGPCDIDFISVASINGNAYQIYEVDL